MRGELLVEPRYSEAEGEILRSIAWWRVSENPWPWEFWVPCLSGWVFCNQGPF